MKNIGTLLLLLPWITACQISKKNLAPNNSLSGFTIAFGSCNKLTLDNFLWDDILEGKPDLWIWGGDIVYADTDDAAKIKSNYNALNEVEGYHDLKTKVPVIGTWDDHDYGLNDGGEEYKTKRQSQEVFLDFMEVPKDDARRKREGIYAAHEYHTGNGLIKVVVLDTRYFRTALTKGTASEKRFRPNAYGVGTILGETQWQWLEEQLSDSEADFNVIVSSIQFLSNQHGFETWGNFPHEVDRLKKLIAATGAKGVLILSGDRHISEFARASIEGLSYPLIDFTSSGLTHSYTTFSGEPNPFRVGEVVTTRSFGVVKLDTRLMKVILQIIGDGGEILGEMIQEY